MMSVSSKILLHYFRDEGKGQARIQGGRTWRPLIFGREKIF